MATGVVARFDSRRGFGFVIPDDGGEDVFVHQNNIEMEGFRFLRAGERVKYELEVGEKGMKAVEVDLLDPRPPQEDRPRRQQNDRDGGYERSSDRDRERSPRNERGSDRYDRNNSRSSSRGSSYNSGGSFGGGDDVAVEKLRRKQERLISLLVEKGILAPGEIDGISDTTVTTDTDDV